MQALMRRVFEGSAQAERQRGRAMKQGIGRICTKLAKTTEVIKCFDIRLVAQFLMNQQLCIWIRVLLELDGQLVKIDPDIAELVRIDG